MELFSISLERKAIGGLLKYPEVYNEISNLIASEDFHNDVHRVIYQIMSSSLSKNQLINKALLCQRLLELGYRAKDDIDISDYIDTLDFTQAKPEVIKGIFRKLKELSIKRIINESVVKITKTITGNEKSVAELVSEIGAIYTNEISAQANINNPINLIAACSDSIPKTTLFQHNGIDYHLNEFYCFISKPNINNYRYVLFDLINTAINKDVNILILDTDNNQDFITISSQFFTGIPMDKICHYYKVASFSFEKIILTIQKWYSKYSSGKSIIIIGKNLIDIKHIQKLKTLTRELKTTVILNTCIDYSLNNDNIPSDLISIPDSSILVLKSNMMIIKSETQEPDTVLNYAQR